MLRDRVLTALLGIPVVVLLIYFGGIPWTAAILLIGILGWRELTLLLQRDHFAVDRVLGLLFVIAAIVEAYLRGAGLLTFDLLRPMLAALVILSLIYSLYDKGEHPTATWAMNVAGALYMGYMLAHTVTLRMRDDGMNWIIIAIALTWIYDSGAFFVGRAIGRRKLWPRLSPKKTWEGLIGGTIVTLIATPLLTGWLVGLQPWLGVALAVLVSIVAPFGDFAVSLLKRMAHTKDSSNLLPGHGGVLDRLDSLLFTIPAITYFVLAVAGG